MRDYLYMAKNLYSSSLLFKSTLSFLVLDLWGTDEGREVPVTPVVGLDFSLTPGPLIFPDP